MFIPLETPIIVYAEGCFGSHAGKTATGVVRYGNWPVSAVIDSRHAGKIASQVIATECHAPIVENLSQALSLSQTDTSRREPPKALLLGMAPAGGSIADSWRAIIRETIEAGLHIVSGLHEFLNEDEEFSRLAKKHSVKLWDVRNPYSAGLNALLLAKTDHRGLMVRRKPKPNFCKVVTMVGTDCSVGKMFTALELTKTLHQAGRRTSFLATGQTGILIAGKGIPLDQVISDFAAAELERILEAQIETEHPELVFVEGQGSLLHPSFSGVTLSLLAGSLPDALILCHDASLTHIKGSGYENVIIPPLKEMIKCYETAARWGRAHGAAAPKVLGVSINTAALSSLQARAYLEKIHQETGLPVTDLVRFPNSEAGENPLAHVITQTFPHARPPDPSSVLRK